MRKVMAFLLTAALLAIFVVPKMGTQAAEDASAEQINIATQGEAFTSKATLLVELSTGQVLSETNAHERLSIASVTKIMSLLLVAEAMEAGELSMEETVTASAHANSIGGSTIWLMPGEEMRVEELIRAVVIQSANDACVALAERVAGSEQGFVDRMNERAQELGMSNTHYVNSYGFDAKDHYSTAYDVSIVSRELMKHDSIRQYMTVWYDELRGGETMLVNTNKLVKSYTGIAGIKTGHDTDAGYCLSACAIRDGFGLIAIVLGASSDDARFDIAASMLDHGFAGYEMLTPQIDSALLEPVRVLHGVNQHVNVKAENLSTVVIPKGKAELVEYDISMVEDVTAPVEVEQAVGKLVITLEGEKIHEGNIVAAVRVERMSFWRAFLALMKSSLQM